MKRKTWRPLKMEDSVNVVLFYRSQHAIVRKKNSLKKRNFHSSLDQVLEILSKRVNVEGLNTHLTDMDILLRYYQSHICILLGVGAASKSFRLFPDSSNLKHLLKSNREKVDFNRIITIYELLYQLLMILFISLHSYPMCFSQTLFTSSDNF